MKSYLTIVCFLVLFGVSEGVYSQSNKSHVRTRMMLNDNGGYYADKIDYFDGLGRLSETVYAKVGGAGQDLVVLTEYDGAGRKEKVWLPASIAGNNSEFVAPATVSRVLQEYGAGNNWQGNSRAVQTTHLSNGKGYVCGKYASSDDGMTVSITRSGNWPAVSYM